jgi:hypothetical protein
MSLMVTQLAGSRATRDTREMLGLYPGVPLSSPDDVASALNAALHRAWAMRVAPSATAADSEPEDEDFTVWNETRLTPEIIESALAELRRQDEEKAATERIGVLRGFGGGDYWKGAPVCLKHSFVLIRTVHCVSTPCGAQTSTRRTVNGIGTSFTSGMRLDFSRTGTIWTVISM